MFVGCLKTSSYSIKRYPYVMFSRLRNNSKTKVNGFNLYTYVKRNKYVYSNALSLYIQMHFILISKKKKKAAFYL